MKKFFLFLFILLFGLLNLKAQVTSGILSQGGLNRTYIAYLPTSYTAGSNLPVVFVLHALTMNGQRMMQVTGMNAVAETNNFIAVYPDGIGGSWNVGFGIPGASTADDVGFIDALADEMVNLYGADLNRLYACGLSNGGFLSYKLACESTKCFAAIAPVSGVITDAAFATCAPTRSVPVLHIHGTADAIVPFNGIVGFKSVNDVLAYWLFNNNNCSGNPTITALPNTNPFDLSTVDRWAWSPCDNGAEVQLLKVNGGGHQWPGTTVLLGGLGTINRDINASAEIWNFFNRFSCNQSAANPIPPAPTASASPNPICLGTSSTLTATASGGNFEWFNTAIGGTAIATGATYTTPALFATTTYWVQTTIGTDVSARTPVVVNIDPNPQPLSPIVIALPAAVCSGSSSVLTSTVPVLGTINWYDTATGGNLVGTGAIFTTPALTTTTTYWAEPVRGNCAGPRTVVSVAVNPIPAAPTITASPATICQGVSSVLTATGGSGTFTWFDAPTGGILLWVGPTYATLPLLNTTTYYVQETDANGCTSARTAITVTVNSLPASPAVAPATICSGTSTTLTATGPGGTYDWYDLPIGGTLLSTGATFTTPALAFTTVYWVQTTDANGCVSLPAAVVVTVNPTPPAPNIVARPAVICSGNTTTLVARTLAGTVNWYDAPTGGNLLGTGRVFTTPVLTVSATTTFTAYADNTLGVCTGPRSAVTVTVNPIPAAPNVAAQTICYGTSATLTPSTAGGTYAWYTVPTGGLPVWIGASYTTLTLTTNTRFFVEAVANGCVSPRTMVVVNVNAFVLPPKLSASPNRICAGSTSTLNAVVPVGTVDWYNVPVGGTPIATGTSYATPPLTVRTTYWATVTVNGCASARTPVTVYVLTAPSPVAIALPPIVCSGWTSTLTVSFPIGGAINWYDAPAGGNLLGTGLAFITPAITATTNFYAETILNGCVSAQRTPVTVILGGCKTNEQTADVLNEETYMNVFPNPSSGIFNIDFRTDNPALLRIFDTAGKVVFTKDYTADKNQFIETIDLSRMAAGLYFIQLRTKDGMLTDKLALE